MADAPRSGRFASRAEKELRRELLVSPLPELGLVAMDGPNDPESELVVEDGRVVRLDGRAEAEFDVIDRFLVAIQMRRRGGSGEMAVRQADLELLAALVRSDRNTLRQVLAQLE